MFRVTDIRGLFFKCLIFIFTISLADFATLTPTKDSGSDNSLVYLIVVVCGLFVIAVLVTLLVSYFQLKAPVYRLPNREQVIIEPPRQEQERLQPGRALTNPVYEPERQPERQPERPTSFTKSWWEIPADDLNVHAGSVLGSGQFGVILLGSVKQNGYNQKCAIKTLKGDASESDRRSLEIELHNMANMDRHPNIVNLIGAQTNYANYFVVVEFCENGDLHEYLKKHRYEKKWVGDPDSGTTIQYPTRIRIAFDIANGMNYLSIKGFIHRDLAARNVLLDGDLRAKVSDFGRSRDVAETKSLFESKRVKNEPVPTRWMPVETLQHQIFTTKSDVWSFGVLLWEIESGGVRPYDNDHTYRQVVDKVVYQGYRLEQPEMCPPEIYDIMVACWNIDATFRPSFGQIAEMFGEMLKATLMAYETVSI